MVLQQPLLKQQIKQATLYSQTKDHNQVSLMLSQSDQSKKSHMPRIKFIITLLIIIFSSFQVYDITTNKLQHSRQFIRFLNFYLIQHDYFDIYWAGQYMLNYPVQEYQLVGDVNQFLKRFDQIMNQLDDYVYGVMDFGQFVNRPNKIYLQPKKGGIISYDYIISQGFKQPFQVDNISSIKSAILSASQIQITLQKFNISNHVWNLMISITTFSETSIFIQIYANQDLPLHQQHFTTFILGLILLSCLIKQYMDDKKKWFDNLPFYLVCVFLINTFFASLNTTINVKWVVILDGIQCCAAWLLILKFLQKQDDYHISFLIRKSYKLVGKLFASFGPIFIAFSVFGYTLFCRQAWQFGTFRRTFLTLFYISYYNATYESFIVTMRANPISMIFFFSFVILFTICVYSGMLVSVFCSYVWNKRESKIKQQIVQNLKIQCSQCNYKYKYIECVKLMKDPKRSLKMSFVLQVDFNSVDQRNKYKKILIKKMNYLNQRIMQLTAETKSQISKSKSGFVRQYGKTKFFQPIKTKINFMLKQQLPNVQIGSYLQSQNNKKDKQKNA